MNILKNLKNRKYRNAEMVKYWMTKEAEQAKVMQMPGGHYAMQIRGEKYLFPGHPRGVLLFGKLSKLKHEIKNQVFNEVWRLLEENAPENDIRHYLQYTAWPNIQRITEDLKYDIVPFEQLQPPVKEIYRAMVAAGVDEHLTNALCFILQEDDAYRMRFQWMVKFFPRWRKPNLEDFAKAADMLEHAEIVGDMKERVRLFKRIMLFMAGDTFKKFLRETNWKKVGLTKADKYFFRAKYFKVDYPEYDY